MKNLSRIRPVSYTHLCAEVTFRTEAAEESIRLMHEAYPDMVLAAGTVLTTEQVDRAVAAGASVIVSPGFEDVYKRQT